MKLKAFDIDDVFYDNVKYNRKTMLNDVKEKLNPYVLHYATDDSIGICLDDKKKDIVKILSGYGKVNTKGNFININTFLCNGNYGWDDIQLGNYELNGEEVWSEFGKLLKDNEQILIDAGDKFEEEWHKLQKLAIRNIFDRIVNNTAKEIEYAEKDFNERVGMYK